MTQSWDWGAHGRWLLLSDDWAWAEHGWFRLPLGFPRGPVSLGVDADFRCGRGGSVRTPVSPVLPSWLSVGMPLLSGHTGGEAGCLSLTRVSQASATISCMIALPADDDEATACSLIGRMASVTLRRPISCSSFAAATRASLVLVDSSVFPAITMSRPGVWGNDVTGDATGPTSVIRSPDTTGPNSCWSGDSSGCSWPEGTTTTDQSDGVGSHSSSLSWR